MVTERKGARLLRKFLDKHDISVRGAAKALSVAHSAMLAWFDGSSAPDEINRRAIERWTGGAVPLESWTTRAEMQRRRDAESVEPFKGKVA